MSLAVDLLRPYWLQGIQQVTVRAQTGFSGWLTRESYQIYAPLTPSTAIISVADLGDVVSAMAFDCAKMASASVETAHGIELSAHLPKSIGWPLIRSYYAAFFAGHALLRMFGRSCSNLDGSQLASLHLIAELYASRSGVTLAKGQYKVFVDVPAKVITLQRMTANDGGSHIAMWGMLVDLLRDLSSLVLSGSAPTRAAQTVAAKLTEIELSLTDRGGNLAGSWLSQIRNRTNYQLAFGAWFPYSGRVKYYDNLFVSNPWPIDPLSFTIWDQPGRDLQRFLETCIALVALSRSMVNDMARRCTKGKSIHQHGSLALDSRLRA